MRPIAVLIADEYEDMIGAGERADYSRIPFERNRRSEFIDFGVENHEFGLLCPIALLITCKDIGSAA